jgi:glyoxylase-like metal-dependent hydrolase (beta-lactamase superfamily II)
VRQVSPLLDMGETAVAQVRALGLAPADVRDIALTHMDLDHAGGIADFPEARIHVRREERDAALARAGSLEQRRYRPGHFAHGPRFAPFAAGGERWFGFEGVRELFPGEPDVLLVPLPGHTIGHTGVAVRGADGWLMHAGDGYFHHGQVATPPYAPLVLEFFQRRGDTDRRQREYNQERLRQLRASHGHEITIFCAHDPVEFDALATRHGRAAAGIAAA